MESRTNNIKSVLILGLTFSLLSSVKLSERELGKNDMMTPSDNTFSISDFNTVEAGTKYPSNRDNKDVNDKKNSDNNKNNNDNNNRFRSNDLYKNKKYGTMQESLFRETVNKDFSEPFNIAIDYLNETQYSAFSSTEGITPDRRQRNSYIRHQKSRRSFSRTRKSPKMRTESQITEPRAKFKDDPTEAPESNVHYNEMVLLNSAENKSSLFDNYTDTFNQTDSFDDKKKGSTLSLREEEIRNQEGMDVVTKFLTIVESQHLLGENCTKGTDFNLGEGVVDRYAQERFKLEAEVAVNRANLYTRLWKYSREQVLVSEFLFHAEVLSIVEFDEDIFAAGNCYDKYEYPNYMLFCPFAYRLPDGHILVKDLAVEYKYLSKTAEWFYIARKTAEKVIENNTQLKRGFHTYTYNDTAHTERELEEILNVTYEDGRWSKPYFDCGGGNIWMMTYTVPFFGYSNGSYHFKGTSGIDIDLRRVDIDQCPLPPGSVALNIFANSDKCKKRTTKCVTVPGLGFRRGSYKCICRDGYYFPDVFSSRKYYNGSIIEEEYEKKLLGEENVYNHYGTYECLKCAEGCDVCENSRPCVVTLNWVMRTSILILSLIIILCLPGIVFFTWRYGNVKVVRAASPVLLRIIILGALFIYSTTLVLYPIPTIASCTVRVWLREIGFSLSYGALMLKTWRISVIFRVRSAKAVKITDLDLMKRLGVIVGTFAVFLGIRTVVDPPQVIVSMTADDLKAFLCSSDWWDHSFTFMELMFLAWGIRLCIVVRKAPSEFNESKFISMAIYNEFLLSLFLNVSMIFLQSPANPDLLFIIFFCHTQLTITLLICLIFGSKVYMVLKGHGKGDDSFSMTKPMAAKFLQKPKSNSHIMCSITSSSGCLTEGDIQEEFKKLYLHLESLKEKTARYGNQATVGKIIAMQEAATAAAPPPKKPEPPKVPKVEEKLSPKSIIPKTKLSEGVLITPHVNSILATVTEKIVCATLQESPETFHNNCRSNKIDMTLPIKSFTNLNENNDSNSNLDLNIEAENASDNRDAVTPPKDSITNSNTNFKHLNKIDSIEECSSPTFKCSSMRYQTNLYLYCSAEDIVKRTSRTNSVTVIRRCRSMENIIERTTKINDHRSKYDETLDNFSLRSMQCSPRFSRQLDNSFDDFREIRDAERARAFILLCLTDRSSLTEEVTV